MVVMDTGARDGADRVALVIVTLAYYHTIQRYNRATTNLQDPEGRRARGGAAYNNSAVAVDREGMASIGSQYR